MTIGGATRILGIFGDPVSHSLSPAMQNAALEEAGIDAVYVPFHVRPSDLPAAVAALRALHVWGVNVTIPHKEAICSHLDELDEEARLIGAVNTVVNRDGRLIGYNTDGVGLLRSLEEDFSFVPAGRRILLLGAGGACRAAVAALAGAGARWIGVANRTESRARQLVGALAPSFEGTSFAYVFLAPATLAELLPAVDLVINTSAVGLHGESFPEFPWAALKESVPVYDMVYAPAGTPLLQTAAARGHRVADGRGMLAAQGEEAFFLWSGRRPRAGLMRRVIMTKSLGI